MSGIDYKKILVVDDEFDIAELMADIIESLGHEVKMASNGIEALEILKTFNAFLVVSDINMPEMNGIELLEKTQEFTECRPYVLLCTGFDGYERNTLMEKGAIDLLSKPFEFTDLKELILKLSDKS